MYPHTQKGFTVNGQAFHMWAPTLLFKAKLEDKNYNMTYLDILKECTDIPAPIMDILPPEEMEKICEDAMMIGVDEERGGGSGKRASELIAMLLDRGHQDPGAYRIDFARIVFEEYDHGSK